MLLSRSDPEGLIGATLNSLRQAGQTNPAILIRMADIIGELARTAPARCWREGLGQQLGKIGETAHAAQLVPADLSDVRRRLDRAAEALARPASSAESM